MDVLLGEDPLLRRELTQVYANTYGSYIVPTENAEPLKERDRENQGRPHEESKRRRAAK